MTEQQIVSIIFDMMDEYKKASENWRDDWDLAQEAGGNYNGLADLLRRLGYRYNEDTDAFIKQR